MATDVETLIIAVKTKDFAQAQRELNKLKRAAKEAEDATEGLNNETGKTSGRAFPKLRGATSALTNTTGQLSVQIQDVGVQLQQGTDAVRIFAQQGPQIASIFGPTGAVFGAIIAFTALIGGPFIKSLFAANEALKASTKFLKEYNQEFDKLTESQRAEKLNLTNKAIKEQENQITQLEQANEGLRRKIEALSDRQEQSNVSQIANIALIKQAEEEITKNNAARDLALQKLRDDKNLRSILLGVLEEETKETKNNKQSIEDALEAGRKRVQVLGMSAIAAELYRFKLDGATETEIEARRVQLEAIAADEARTRSLQEKTRAMEQAESALARFIETQEKQATQKDMSITMRLLTEATRLATKAGRELTLEEFRRINVVAERLQQIEDEKQAIKDADEVDKLAKKAQIERERQLADERARNQARIKAEQDSRDREAAESRRAIRDAENEARSAGLLDVERDEIDAFNRRQERGKELARNMLLSERQRIEITKNLEKDKNDFMVKNAGDAINSLGQVNAQAFKVAKLYNIGQAVMNTYTGATKALAELPPPASYIAAAATVAAGLAQVQQIRSQQFAGRALGGQVRAGESYLVGERGPEVLTMGRTGKIIPNEKIRTDNTVVNKTANVTFQITAVDASGFDQLLQSRRGQIVGMINSALNDQGRRAIA